MEVGDRAARAAATLDSPRFLTLTMPAVDAPLREQLRGMRQALARLRRAPAWTSRVRGGLYSVQITRNTRTGKWHPHLHCIIDGEYFPHDEIREAWRFALNCTAGPWSIAATDPLIVDIRAIPSREKAARYIARYVCSPNDIASWGNEAILEYANAVKGMRMLTLFGSLHGMSVADADNEETSEQGEFVTTLECIERDARAGDDETITAAWILGEDCRTFRRACKWARVRPSRPVEPKGGDPVAWAKALLRTRYLTRYDPERVRERERERRRMRLRSDRRRTLFDALKLCRW